MANLDDYMAISPEESLLSNNSSNISSTGNINNINNGISSSILISGSTTTMNPTVLDDSTDDTVFMRFTDLEKKLQDQQDEIVCLKSTLADVLRRLAQLEGRAIVTTSYHHISPTSSHLNRQIVNKNNLNNGSTIRRYSSSTSSSSTHGVNTDFQNNSSINGSPNSSPTQSMSSNATNNNHRMIHQSNHHHHPVLSKASSSLMRISNSNSNLRQMKKWSASQEIRMSSMVDRNRLIKGSLHNLHAAVSYNKSPICKINNVNQLPKMRSSAGNFKDFYYNQVEGVIKFQIGDRSILINIPTEFLQTYTINQIVNPPTQRLKLEWVYGYRGKDCRHNLYLLPTGEIVYFIASVVVLYNIDDQIQRHYTGHSSEIRCLTIHPNKLIIATGQNCSNYTGASNIQQDPNMHRILTTNQYFQHRPHIRIWDSVSLNTLHILGQNFEFDRGISCISFSKCDGGSLLCAVDDSNDHIVSLWEWQKGSSGHKVCEAKSTCDPVLVAEFHPIEKNTLITIGRGHIYFWDIEGSSLAKKVGTFEKQDKPKYLLCMAFNDIGELLTGDSNGNVIIWHQNLSRLVRTIYNAHDGPIFDICALKDGTFVTGGGKDKQIIEWDSNMNKTGRVAKLPDQYGGVRTLTTGKGSMLIVGTTKNCILQGTMALNFSLVIQGHTDELHALAIHPTQNQFITAGYDKNIHLWDTMSHLVVWSKDIGESAHSATFSPDGGVIIVSTTSTPGRWIVFDATTRQLVSIQSDGTDLIECMKFSPNGRYLALASRDNNIYIYQVSDEFRKFNRIGRCAGHSSYVTSIDWDSTNNYIQTTTEQFEHLFWNATICRPLANVSISRDLEFPTHNCLIGFQVFGIWPENSDSPSAADRSHKGKLLVTGDYSGKINLFQYPASQPKCLYHSYQGHSEKISCARFLTDDSRVISIGGRDTSILQWSVT